MRLPDPREDDGYPPLPPQLAQLIKDVGRARTRKQFNPDRPLHPIGRFEAVVTLGRGGFGLVFKVRDPRLDREVALKICLAPGPEARAAIEREAMLLAKLSHPNVITVHETGQYGDDVFFVMELVEGETGDDFIYKPLPPSWEQSVDIYRAAGSGLAAAHDAGIIHGDFKPANILIDRDGRPRVVDFGLAQIQVDHAPEAERGELRFRLGTLPYMAPEVLGGQVGDALSDQWSFCVALWETLERTRPFPGRTREELLAAIEDGEPLIGTTTTPRALRKVLRRGLSREPGERWPDMHALVRELDKLRAPPPAGGESKGVFLISMLVVAGMVLGALAARHVPWPGEVEETITPTEPMPVEGPACVLPASLDPSTAVDPTVLQICGLIRDDHLEAAHALWEHEYMDRIDAPDSEAGDEARTQLGVDALIIASTFTERAEELGDRQPSEARLAARYALDSVAWAALLLDGNPDTRDLRDRAMVFGATGQ